MNETSTRLQLTRLIKAKPAEIFAAWTQPELIVQWFAPGTMTVPQAETDLRSGGRYTIRMMREDGESFTTWGHYKEIIPNRKLVFTWGWDGPERHESLVTVEFKEHVQGTEIVLTHERLANAEQTRMHAEGWNGCLENLELLFNV